MNKAETIVPVDTWVERLRKLAQNFDSVENFDKTLLGVLNVVERDPRVSQRLISRELGVALGLANAYLKRCVRKGLIKISQVPKRRYYYYLTPQGFTEKARLTGEYLSLSLSFFRAAREQMSDIFATCAANGYGRVVLAGVSDLTEVARLCAYDHDIELVGIVDASQSGGSFHGLPVFATLSADVPVDAVIVTGLNKSQTIYQTLSREIGPDRIFIPRLLQLRMPQALPGKVAAE